MSASRPTEPVHDSDDYVPSYTFPDWYHQRSSGTSAAPIPWYSVSPPVPPATGCLVCGAADAVHVTIRRHVGLILAMRSYTNAAHFCVTCGTARVREMTTRTLWQGWWGVGSLLYGAPVALVSNWRAHRRLHKLRQPLPMYGKRPLPLGRPVARRPLAYVALVPVLILLTWVISASASGS